MPQLVDITGLRFGKLTAVRVSGRDSHGRALWECRCDCGASAIVQSGNLRTGNSESCGCSKFGQRNVTRLIGARFGRLTVIAREATATGKAFWRCVCDCGETRVVWGGHLANGHTRSCGCLIRDTSRVIAKTYLAGKCGPDHPRWKSNLSDADRETRRTDADKQWSRAVLERARYKCAICGAGGRLQAHHLMGYARHKTQRTVISNGIALCRGCHKEFHRTRGYSGFTVDDFFDHFNLPNPGPVEGLRLPTTGHLGNAVKYIARCEHKGKTREDLEKAKVYIDRYLDQCVAPK